MKDILNEERENMSNKLKIFYIAIIIICIIAVIVAIVIQTRTDEEEAERPISQVGQEQISTYQEVLIAIFTAIVQGILVAGASVYINQLIKQNNKEE